MMDRRNRRLSKIIDLALTNAGISEVEGNLNSVPSQIFSTNTDAYNVNMDGDNLKQKKQDESLINERVPITASTSNVDEESIPKMLTIKNDLLIAADKYFGSETGTPEMTRDETDSLKITRAETISSSFQVNIGFVESELPDTPSINQIADDELNNTSNIPTAGSIQRSDNSTNSTVDEHVRPDEGSKVVSRKCRKRNCKTDKRYIDYLSDEDFSTFMDYDGADFDSDEWIGSETSIDDDINESLTKKRASKSKKKKKRENDIQEEEVVGETAMRQKKKNSKRERQQRRATGDEYARKDGKVVT
ncbi:unnamed protein product [Spodoptera exigua]|nr:unnamed protein product [Spodoptera exigua]